MRSEKEIKEQINHMECLVDNSSLDGEIEHLNWVLEGEFRYSVAELEKLFTKWSDWERAGIRTKNGTAMMKFFDFLKDKKRVEEILHG